MAAETEGGKPILRSKKFWVAVASVLVPVINSRIPGELHLEAAEVGQVLAPLMAYVLGQGLADLKKSALGGVAEKPPWKSKKFITAVLGSFVPAVAHWFGVPLNPEVMLGVAGTVSAYVTGQGLADLGKNAKPA